MPLAFSHAVRSSRLDHHRSRRYFSRPPVLLILLVLIAMLLAAAIGGPVTLAASTSSFAAKQDFATGVNPRFVAVGDLNGDGKLDLAVVNQNSDSVSVLLNTTVPGAATPSFTARLSVNFWLGSA